MPITPEQAALTEALLRQPKALRRKLLDAMGPEGIVLRDDDNVRVVLKLVLNWPDRAVEAK